jgi:hypothetical protein
LPESKWGHTGCGRAHLWRLKQEGCTPGQPGVHNEMLSQWQKWSHLGQSFRKLKGYGGRALKHGYLTLKCFLWPPPQMRQT